MGLVLSTRNYVQCCNIWLNQISCSLLLATLLLTSFTYIDHCTLCEAHLSLCPLGSHLSLCSTCHCAPIHSWDSIPHSRDLLLSNLRDPVLVSTSAWLLIRLVVVKQLFKLRWAVLNPQLLSCVLWRRDHPMWLNCSWLWTWTFNLCFVGSNIVIPTFHSWGHDVTCRPWWQNQTSCLVTCSHITIP
jgi:hypothetical protein